MRITKTPCNECPFRKNSVPGWLGPWKADELLETINSEAVFPCYNTLGSEDGEESEKEPLLCRGSVLFMAKKGQLPRNPLLRGAVAIVKAPGNGDMENIMTPKEFMKHHIIWSL